MNRSFKLVFNDLPDGTPWLGTVNKNARMILGQCEIIPPANVMLVIVSTDPPSIAHGDKLWLQIDSNGNPLGIYKVVNGQWVIVNTSIHYGALYPGGLVANLNVGTIYYNTTLNQLFYLVSKTNPSDATSIPPIIPSNSNGLWQQIGGITTGLTDDNFPTSPADGQQHLNYGRGGMFIYSSLQKNWLPVEGFCPAKVTSESAYDLNPNRDYTLLVDTNTANTININLPYLNPDPDATSPYSLACSIGRSFQIVDRAGNAAAKNIIINTRGSYTRGGVNYTDNIQPHTDSDLTTYKITTAFGAVILMHAGNQWQIISKQ